MSFVNATAVIARIKGMRFLFTARHVYRDFSGPGTVKSCDGVPYSLEGHRYFAPTNLDLFVVHFPEGGLGMGLDLAEESELNGSSRLYAAGWGGGQWRILTIASGSVAPQPILGDSGAGVFGWPEPRLHGLVVKTAQYQGLVEVSANRRPPSDVGNWRTLMAAIAAFPEVKTGARGRMPGEIGTLQLADLDIATRVPW